MSSTDLATANALLATLGGYIDGYSQTFNVTSRTSGFVASAPFIRHFLRQRATPSTRRTSGSCCRISPLTLGLRYELPGVVDEADSLELSPVLTGTAEQTLLSNATLNFAGASVGRPWYHRDWKDFAPNFGFAWDVFGDGKTAVRGGYSISYVNDQEILAPETLLEANAGLQGIAATTGLSNRVSTGLPQIVRSHLPGAPDGRRQLRQQPVQHGRNDRSQPEPALRAAVFHRHPAPVRRARVFEARYVGNHVVGAYRAFDFNQVVINQNGFLPDFLRAQNNGFLAHGAEAAFSIRTTMPPSPAASR